MRQPWEKIPSIIDQYKAKNEVLECEIPQLQEIAGKVWKKEDELKYTVREQRPDKSGRNSFPSGHTAAAFMGAEFLWQEYKDVSPWYGIGGYVIAAGTGALRAWNNKHWVWDVVFGAGLGMLCTKLAYRLYPSVQCKLSKKKEKVSGISFYPYYNGQQGGLSVKYDF